MTAAETAEKKRRRSKFMTIFLNGKQKQVRRPLSIEEPDEEFILRNADPSCLHQNELWKYMLDDRKDEAGIFDEPETDGQNKQKLTSY